MKTFRRILVWVEESPEGQQAVERAVTLARESGAAVTFAHCIEPPHRLLSALYAHTSELHAMLQQEWHTRLNAIAARVADDGIPTHTRLLEGRPFLAFTRAVLEGDHDLLIKPADDTGEGVKLGAHDMHLMRKCPCAVWIIGSEPASDRRILTLVNPSPDEGSLNLRLLSAAQSLAATRGAELHVAHVWDAAGASLLAKHIGPEALAQYADEARRRAAGELAHLLGRHETPIPEDRVHLVRGAVKEAVPELVERLDPGLIVMGTVSRIGIKGWLIGNTAETILARTNRPVLTIKPKGFVSPVTLDAA